MSQKLPVNSFKWVKNTSKIDEKFIKSYDEDSVKGYIFEVDVKYPKRLHDLHSDLPFLPKRMKIDKCKKLLCNLRNKKKYVVHIRSLKQAPNYGLKLKKVHRIVEFHQESWLKPHIDMNTELRKIAKNDFEKDFFKLMNNAVFGKTMENVRKHRDIKLVITDKKRSKLVSEPNYHTMNYISEDLSIIEMKLTKLKMNKLVYLGLSILEISKLLMYEFWYDFMKPKYGDNVKLCYMDTDSFIMNIKTEDFYKDELGGRVITEFVALRPKTYSYLTDDCKEDKKAKGTNKCVIKRMIKFDDYKNCLLNGEVIVKSQQRFIRKGHDVCTENINKIALSSNDDQRIVSSDKITSYPYRYKGKNALIQ